MSALALLEAIGLTEEDHEREVPPQARGTLARNDVVR